MDSVVLHSVPATGDTDANNLRCFLGTGLDRAIDEVDDICEDHKVCELCCAKFSFQFLNQTKFIFIQSALVSR